MNSWDIIKSEFVKDQRQGSAGWYWQICRAMTAMSRLMHNIKDIDDTTTAINADPDIMKAIGMKENLKSLFERREEENE